MESFLIGDISNPNWSIEIDGNNHVLNGSIIVSIPPATVRYRNGQNWTNYSMKIKVKLINGSIRFLFRVAASNHDDATYFIDFSETGLSLNKALNYIYYDLVNDGLPNSLNTWHDCEVIGIEGNIKVYVDGDLRLEYTDPNPILNGTIGFSTFDDCHVQVDDVFVSGKLPTTPEGYKWIKTGGPSGGLGYDVRIHPTNKQIMFVTDNPSGVNKSFDGGNTWIQKNNGINVRTGASGDAIPIFCLTIDPNNPNIVWAGTQYNRGIYKSIDGGETWVKKDNGVVENTEISFRGFGIHPQNSNIIFAGAEITIGILGRVFDKTKGKIYKTTDGGENWRCVWEGDNLARFVIFDYSNPNILYASTGIWDREAFNEVGVGVLKSYNGGETWIPINNGMNDLYVGFLEMHPTNPQILYAATGLNEYSTKPGVYKTVDGGANWTQMLDKGDVTTTVTISPSNPNIVYAGANSAFYRSYNGGVTWDVFNQDWGWGPPGVRSGVSISAVVDPDDPMTVFVNNYTGGNFKSTDGGASWVNASKGYTGAHLHSVAVSKSQPNKIFTVGRNGPFGSNDYGQNWAGLAYTPARAPEWNTIVANPVNDQILLLAVEGGGTIFKSDTDGNSWRFVLEAVGYTCCGQGFKAIDFAPSNPNIVYAGMRGSRSMINGGPNPLPSGGMYKSIDEGETWTPINNGLQTSLMNVNCLAIHPTNPNIVYIGTWKDGIFKTIDGGQSWVNKSNGLASADVRSLAIDPKNPEIVYAGLGEGVGLFKTTTGGELWENINTGITLNCPAYLLPSGGVKQGMTFEKPPLISRGLEYYYVPWTSVWGIVVDPTNSDILYAADYQTGVYLSTDKGANWVPINEGLTIRAVTALAISKNGRYVYAATEGGGVFRLRTPGCCDVYLPLIFKN